MSCCDGFRLSTPSECSLRSKARIDALFEDSHSICSSSVPGGGWCVNLEPGSAAPQDDDQQLRVNSAVQARIEAMFASVEAENATPGECAAAVLPVKYMGAAPVGGRVASVRGLQEPLRQLLERIDDAVSAELEVSRRGLTFRTSELHEKNNPFRRIAVWSALKLQIRRRNNSLAEPVHAFVPLVADDRGINTSTTNSEDRHAELYRTMRGLSKDPEDYPPIFAVVMRRPGAARLLECHAFACHCDEDAIAAAATLYRALLVDLDATARRPRQRNGVGCVSLASVVSSIPDTSIAAPISKRTDFCRPKLPPPPFPLPLPPSHHQPVRPPRSKRSSASSATSVGDKQSSPTVSPSMNGSEKSPLMKKKDLEVNVVNVLEERTLRTDLSSNNQGLSKSDALARRIDNNSNSEQTNEERRMNAKNKIYGTRVSHCQPVTGEVPVIEICEERKAREPYDENEKSLSDHERIGSYNHNCYTENSLYESSRIYAEVRTNGSKSRFGLPPLNRKPINGSSCVRRDAYKDSARAEQRRRTRSIAARHRDHFRDVDKIYNLGPQEEYVSAGNNCNDRIYDSARTTRQIPVKPRYDEVDRSRCSSRLPGHVSTLDCRLQKDNVQPKQHPQHQQKQQHQQQQQQLQQRRRNRAGSEPPSSRTEAAAAATAALLRRSQSELDLDRGDLMTRVELPRHGSFLKPGSVRKRDGPEGGNAGTPLGFTELFDEFRNQEGLTSVDDILAAIIDPEGMSFNDLKPLYKEFLLKLAATLTQDELYERSASIMRRRRRPQRRRSIRGNGGGGGGRACLLRRAIKRSVSKLKSSGSAPTEFTSIVYPARKLNEHSGSFGSSSSCDARRNVPPEPIGYRHRASRILSGKLDRRRSSTKRCPSNKSRVGHTTSEDSDTCRRMSRAATTANRSSSGYVSCSECSYDSESCTCVSADKCYCSLSRKMPEGPTATLCSCDTDSCSESNKCYCSRKRMVASPRHLSILEQLRQKGILPSESTLSRTGSPDRARSIKANRNLATSKSLEYLKVPPSQVRGSTENLALDYDLFSPGGCRSSHCSSGSEKVLVVSARDPQGRLIYVGETDKRSSSQCKSNRRYRGSTADHEALSIKKNAEIAAVFSGAGHSKVGRRASSTSSIRSSISLEAGLGYLP